MENRFAILGMSEDSNRWYVEQLMEASSNQDLKPQLYPSDFEKINALLPQPSEALKQLLTPYLTSISGIVFLLVPNISIHETLDELFSAVSYSFSLIHPIQLTIEKLKQNNIFEVVIFGSSYTMQAGYIYNQLADHGIRSTFPTAADKKSIDTLRLAVYQNKASEQLLKEFTTLISTYTDRYPVVLACTELSIASNGNTASVYDMGRIQIEYCLKHFLK